MRMSLVLGVIGSIFLSGCGSASSQNPPSIQEKVNALATQTNAPALSDIARNADGSIRYMVQSSEYMTDRGLPLENGEIGAMEYCDALGMHLPAIRELAQYSQSEGAAGLSEDAKGDFSVVKARNGDGKLDEFYFSASGYRVPGAYEEGLWFWSSSTYTDDSYVAYDFRGFSGEIGYDARDIDLRHATRCAPGQISISKDITSPLTFADIARNLDGSIKHMNWFEAKDYCANQGMHLPTARQFTALAATMGAPAILETKFPADSIDTPRVKTEIQEMELNRYGPIFKYKKPDHGELTVDFYRNIDATGYLRPSGDLGNEIYWTATDYIDSITNYESLFYGNLGLVWNGDEPDQLSFREAVRCAQGP